MIQRKSEHFGKALPIGFVDVVSVIPPRLYKQERDWTCSVACLRSIASKYKDLGSEDEIVSKYKMDHGRYVDFLMDLIMRPPVRSQNRSRTYRGFISYWRKGQLLWLRHVRVLTTGWCY